MALGRNDVTITVGAITKGFDRGMKRMRDGMGSTEARAAIAFGAIAIGITALAVPTAMAISEFQKFSLGLAKVQKVADMSKNELKKFEKNIDALSRKIPISTEELFNTAEAAAVLGIRGADNLTKFSETMGMLGVATDVHGEEAAKSISRIIQLSGESIDTIDRFGSALVELGNNFKASESEILANATRIRQATAAYDIASTEILAMATATKEAGIRSELAGTAIGRTIRAMDNALAMGGKKLRAFEEIMEMTGAQIDKVFRDSPARAFQIFVKGLDTAKRPTAESGKLLRAMGLQGERLMSVLPSLAKIHHRLTDAMDKSNESYRENNALVKEANAFFDESAKKTELLGNKFRSLSKTIGSYLTPAWDEVSGVLGNIIDDFNTILGGREESIEDLEKTLAKSGKSMSERTKELIRARIETLKEKKELDKIEAEKSKETGPTGSRDISGGPTGTGSGTGGKGTPIDDNTNIEQDIDRREAYLERLREYQLREYEQTEEFHNSIKALLEERIKSEDKALSKKSKEDLENLDKHLKRKNQIEKQREMMRLANNSSLVLGETQKLMNSLAASSSANNEKIFRTQQALSVAQVIMDTAVGMTRQYADMPYPMALVMKGLVLASGLAQLAVIKNQKLPEMQTGGLVGRSRGTPATGDHQLALLEPNEFVTPRRNADEEIDKRAREKGYARNDLDEDENEMKDYQEMRISFDNEISNFVFSKQRRNRALGIGVT